MNLQQLRYIAAMASNGLNMTAAAERLHTSQPGMSRQIRALEDELGVRVFERAGKTFTGLTPFGEILVRQANEVIDRVERVRQMSEEFRDPSAGTLRIATTHTQAQYVLPDVIARFRRRYDQVDLHLHQGSPAQIAEMASRGEVDFAIATEALEHFSNLLMMPCYEWSRSAITLRGHALTNLENPSLKDIAEYPLLTYVFGFTGRSNMDEAFRRLGLTPNVVFTATDADVIKTYVRLGMGVGIVAGMAVDPVADDDLVAIDLSSDIRASQTNIGFQRNLILRGFMYDFIEMFAPHLTRNIVERAVAIRDDAERHELFQCHDLPTIGCGTRNPEACQVDPYPRATRRFPA